MLDNKIINSERLYKAIKFTVPVQWDYKKNRPTSAAFKDSKGVSVDRKGGRKLNQIIKNFQYKFGTKAIISLTAGFCREKNTHPVARPLPDNKYHAEIYRSPDIVSLTNSQARALSRNSVIEFIV